MIARTEGGPVIVRKVGYTGHAFRIYVDGRTLQIRTTTRRRYLVVDLAGGYLVKRTDNLQTAKYALLRCHSIAIVLDTVRVNREGEITI